VSVKTYFVKYSYDSDSKGITRGNKNAYVDVDVSNYQIVRAIYESVVIMPLTNFTVDFMIEIPEGEN
jgi:hypothetical protein